MKNFIVIIGTIFVLASWSIPFIIYQITDDGRSFLALFLSLGMSVTWIEWINDKWNSL